MRLLNAAAATLAVGVLTDGTAEHYRAAFHNRAMFVATAVSAAAAAVATASAVRPQRRHAADRAVFGASIVAGLLGFGFHVINVSRRAGGVNATNIFRGAPVGAPIALAIAGLFGIVAARVHPIAQKPGDGDPAVSSTPRGRTGFVLGNAAAIGLAGTSIEAGILHFRGAFHNPLMYAPAIVPPIAALSLTAATLTPSERAQRIAGSMLRLTGWLGITGVALHSWGVHRRMGGWRNWSQNVLAGPPIPAPPAFTGMALAGLAALELLRPSPHRAKSARRGPRPARNL